MCVFVLDVQGTYGRAGNGATARGLMTHLRECVTAEQQEPYRRGYGWWTERERGRRRTARAAEGEEGAKKLAIGAGLAWIAMAVQRPGRRQRRELSIKIVKETSVQRSARDESRKRFGVVHKRGRER